MCGIAGIHTLAALPSSELEGAVRAMTATLAHRGPDADGVYLDRSLALGHRRLSILDLSEAGAQPMTSEDGRYTLVLNGEIYNHLELRELLGPRPWRGTSDTETLLAGLERWRPEKALERLRGMFSFAFWDARLRTLLLARDRLGEKPLYYARIGQTFLFASELKALRAHPEFDPEIDREALAGYLRHSYVPGPRTIYRDAKKLQPGHMLRVDMDGMHEPEPYWSLRGTLDAAEPFDGSPCDAADRLEALLREAVRGQMLADVPLGALLSGGIDSSLIVALMQAENPGRVRTFTIGSADPAYDEAAHARAVAAHLGTEHTELVARPEDALELVGLLPEMYDEPFADASQLPTRLVCGLTREHVTVCLSGDGGDEFFAGYNRHFWAPGLWDRFSRVPSPLRRTFAAALRAASPRSLDTAFGLLGAVLPEKYRQRTPGQKLHKLAQALPARSREEMYALLASIWPDPASLLVRGTEPIQLWQRPGEWPKNLGFARWMQYMDAATYLPDDILVKVDRAAMSVSLETRAPYLDHKVVEFAATLPPEMQAEPGRGKLLLRRVLERHVPRELFERPKTGFGIPLGLWLRTALRPWAEELLGEKRLEEQGLLRPAPIRKAWKDHLAGRADNEYKLWNVLMLQAWLERWI
jgi:asparagine synthase (glutamine-hydrolysing)